MDMAFVNAANASSSFPPHDPWMAGEDLNYYYLGHLAMAMVHQGHGRRRPTRATTSPFALLAALSAAAVFTLARHAVGGRAAAARRACAAGRWRPGVAAVVVCIVLGNLAGVREWLDAAGPPGDYDWFAPSRVIPGTINEFPWFSFLLGDLHAHVLALPFTVARARRSRCRSRSPARAATRSGAASPRRSPPGSRSAPCTRSTRGRIRSRPGLLVLAVAHLAAIARERGPARVRGQLARARAGRERRARAAVLAQLRPGRDAGSGWVDERRAVHALRRRPGAALRHLRRAAGRRVRRPRARHPAAAAHARVERGGGDLRAARCSRPPTSPGAAVARRAARGRARRAALAPARRARALPVAAGRRRPDLRARARARLRARRVRRQRPVPHEHGLQARLPGVAAAGGRRRVRAAVGGRLAAAPGVAGVGGASRRCCCCSAPSTRTRAPTRARAASRASPTLDGLALAARRARPATRRRSTGCARTRRARRSCSRRWGRTTRRSATARISTFTGRATVLGWPGHELQWDHEPGSREADVEHALHDHRPRRGARADRPLRRRLRRLRPDRAHHLRRRRPRQVGRARRAGLRPRRHHDLAPALSAARTATRACRRSGSTARAR